jgi:hypothetical protein
MKNLQNNFTANAENLKDKHPPFLVSFMWLWSVSGCVGNSMFNTVFHEEQEMILMWSNENEYTFCSWIHLQLLSISSGLATTVTLTQVSWRMLGQSITWGWDLLLISFLYCNMWLLLGCILNGTLCIKNKLYVTNTNKEHTFSNLKQL